MTKKIYASDQYKKLESFLNGKPEYAVDLFAEFVNQFEKIGPVKALPAKTMIGIATTRKRIAYITQFGKNFIHVVFPFPESYPDNLCFQKIAQVPGNNRQFNHHFRMIKKEDVNEEVRIFMKKAYELGS